MKTPSCYGCAHFKITHETSAPYACAAFGFRSRRIPALEVASSSGQACQRREPAQKSKRSVRP